MLLPGLGCGWVGNIVRRAAAAVRAAADAQQGLFAVPWSNCQQNPAFLWSAHAPNFTSVRKQQMCMLRQSLTSQPTPQLACYCSFNLEHISTHQTM
jgi:hypothetical protein